MAALGVPLFIHLPTYYAGDLALGLSAVGTLLLVARLADVALDPLIGWLGDRWYGRFGRRRPWVVAATPVLMIATWNLFLPPAGVGAAYLLLWSILLYAAWSMLQLPYSAWGAELSGRYDERTRIAAVRETCTVLGTVGALAVPVAIGLATAGGTLASMAWMVVLVLPASILVLVLVVPEPARPKAVTLSWRGSVGLIAANLPFRRLIVAYLLNGIANGLPATLFLLFVEKVIGRPDLAGPLLLLYFLSGIFAVPLWLRLSYRFGKHRTWCGAMIWNAAIFAVVPLLGPGDWAIFLVICILTGAALGADLVLPPAMQADVIDLDTASGGGQRSGFYFALWAMATKLALAIAVGLSFPLLDLAGFKTEGPNTAGALLSLAALYGMAPVVFKAFAIALLWNFPLDAGTQARLRRQIEETEPRAP